MDIKCQYCSEPWDVDSLHDMVEEGTVQDFDEARKNFYTWGCNAFQGLSTPCGTKTNVLGKFMKQKEEVKPDPMIAEMQMLAGDDIDFLASMTEDAMDMNLLD